MEGTVMSKKNALVAVLSVLAIAPLSTVALAGPVSIQPVSQTVAIGQVFSVNISIASITDLYAFQFDLGFNPQVIHALSVTEGSFLSTAGPTFFLPGAVDNLFGTITFNADSLLGAISGDSG